MSKNKGSIERQVAKPVAQTTLVIAIVAVILYLLAKEGLPQQAQTSLMMPIASLVAATTVLLAIMARILVRRVRSLVVEDEEVRFLAFHDTLSGLANRAYFDAQLKFHLRKARWSSCPFGLVMMDLNRFKAVNDTYGHQSGDLVLKAVAERLQNTLRNTDVVARLGGDEFGIILPGTSNEVSISIVLTKMIYALEKPIVLANNHVVDVGAAIGVAICGTDEAPVEALIHRADMAVYEAKKQGGSCYVFAPIPPAVPPRVPARGRQPFTLGV